MDFQDNLSLEIIARDKYVEFYVAAPKNLKDFVESQIYAQYPNVEIQIVPDYINADVLQLADGTSLVLASADLKLNQVDAYPIKTFPNFEVDPLAGITAALSKTEPSEEIWLQMLIRPVPDSWHIKCNAIISSLKSGGPKKGIDLSWKKIVKETLGLIGELVRSFMRAGGTVAEGAAAAAPADLPASVQAALAGIEGKLTKIGFSTQIRLSCLARSGEEARRRIQSVFASFKQYNTTHLNGFSLGEIKFGQEQMEKLTNRSLPVGGHIFNIEELASIYHFPNQSVETPSIVWAGSKKGEPPSNLPVEGTTIREELTVFGRTSFRHLNHIFGIKTNDRRYHFYAIGKTGTGKSTMLENMIFDDINEGRGVAVVDPHGELMSPPVLSAFSKKSSVRVGVRG
ncbi:MAG: Uncharacterized protein CEN88_465 [Candidatus Berkelbacteria bacterium Licking1014_2]|uniref:DUF8128 domain-containing protein n=1 Tax=Candidatus Berkelbacteria bacterium Licking1014_2 TaxID=2017146 RepID=A0A554LRK8_9BACT|nr:MAG: Uncharacterized protein CEN88_465 [Candidatus Berkelbacteria bacterium Licking1014_2]